MAIYVTWEDEAHTLIHITYQRPWSWAEFEKAHTELVEMLNAASHPVDLLLDLRDAGFPPPNALERFKKVSETYHPNTNRLVMVAPRLIAQSVSTMIMIMKTAFSGAFQPPQFEFVGTLEEAHQLLNRQSPAQH